MTKPSQSLKLIRQVSGWTIFLLDRKQIATAEAYRRQAGQVLQRIDDHLLAQESVHLEVFLHVWKMAESPIPDLYREHVRLWLPQLGLGIWPDRPAPAPWTQESFMDAGAHLLKGEEVPMSAYKLLRMTGEPSARHAASTQLLGSGCSTRFWGNATFETMDLLGRELYLPSIRSQAYRNAEFYVSLLSTAAVLQASSADIERWMCGMDVYVQDSAECGGLLIVSSGKHTNMLLDGNVPSV
jgi:hypothetical protein